MSLEEFYNFCKSSYTHSFQLLKVNNMNDGFLDFNGLKEVVGEIKNRVKLESSLPANPSDRDVILYIGEDIETYKKGHIYQFRGTEWVDITPKAASEVSISVELTHNVPRLEPIDITKYLIDGSLWDRIAGTNDQSLMNDIYIGDYLNLCDPNVPNHLSAGINGGTGYVTIAGIDTLQGNYASQKYHHLVMVPGKGMDSSEPQHFGRAPMNSEATTNGGYAGSKMATETLKIASAADSTINGQLYQVFGSHLKTTKELVSNGINATGFNRFGTNNGCSNNFGWKEYQCVLMSEIEVYGSIVWSSSGYDTGNANRQLPLFAFSKIAQNNGTAYYWLKDIATAYSFCLSYDNGSSRYDSANYDICVRPRFVIA